MLGSIGVQGMKLDECEQLSQKVNALEMSRPAHRSSIDDLSSGSVEQHGKQAPAASESLSRLRGAVTAQHREQCAAIYGLTEKLGDMIQQMNSLVDLAQISQNPVGT